LRDHCSKFDGSNDSYFKVVFLCLQLNISFNESATTTYEYPSEISLLAEDEANREDMLGHKSPNVINNAGSESFLKPN